MARAVPKKNKPVKEGSKPEKTKDRPREKLL